MVGDDSGLFSSGCPCDPFISSIDPNMTQIAHSSRLPSSAHLEIQPKYWLEERTRHYMIALAGLPRPSPVYERASLWR